MTRITSDKPEQRVWNGSYRVSGIPGSYPERYTVTVNPRYLRRSDIVINPKVDGWRSPSAYSATCLERGFVTEGGYSLSYPDTVLHEGKRLDTMAHYTASGPLMPLEAPQDWTAFTANDVNRVLTQALVSLKDQKINVGQALAESRQSLDLITTSATRLYRAYSAARRLDWRKAQDTLGLSRTRLRHRNSAQNGWLELHYGWLPLVNDVYGAVDALTSPKRGTGMTLVARSRMVKEKQVSDTRLVYNPTGRTDYGIYDATFVDTYRSELKTSLWYRLDLPEVADLSQLGLLNPAVVAWELVPFSFLVDWMVPVGNYLNALDASIGMTYLGGSTTQYHTITRHVTGRPRAHATGRVTGSLHGNARSVQFGRSVVENPGGSLYYKNPLSVQHAANAVALFLRFK